MYAPLPAALKPIKILFLSRGENTVRTDVKGLRALGAADFTHHRDAAAAVAHLVAEKERLLALERLSGKRSLQNPADLALCDELLGVEPLFAFLRALARHSALCIQPVLVLASTAHTARTLREAGVYVLERPYSQADLDKMAQTAMSPMRRTLKAAKLNPPAPPPRAEPAPARATGKKTGALAQCLALGAQFLREGRTDEAESAFRQALRKRHDNLDAALGMVRLCRARQDKAGVLRYLIKAAAGLKRGGDAARYQAVAEKLPTQYRENIFVQEAIALMREGNFHAAAQNFQDASAEAGQTPLHRIISRACQMTANPDECLRKVCDAYATMGYEMTAAGLRRRLLSYDPQYTPGEHSWLDGFPRFKEAVSVMRYTAWAWRQG